MTTDWVNAGITFLILFSSLLLLVQLLLAFSLRIARRTKSIYDEKFLLSISRYLHLLALVISLNFATGELLSLPDWLMTLAKQIFFSLAILIFAIMVWLLVDHLVLWYQEMARRAGKREPREAALQLIQRTGHILVAIISGISILDHFGVNVTALVATLGIGGLAISLATQDTLSNMVSGVMLVIDQPFRIGDHIEIQGLSTAGDVVDIGLRSTRIRMADNHMVIVPNSSISRNYVINYSYPDPLFREQVTIQVKYGSDPRELREVIIRAVRGVDGVLENKPVDVIFSEFDEETLSLKVRWWLASHSETRADVNRVNEVIYQALRDASIEAR